MGVIDEHQPRPEFRNYTGSGFGCFIFNREDIMMNRNMGNADRVIRLVVGIALLSLFFVLHGNARWLGLIGVVLIGTASMSFCPLYRLLGLSTTGSSGT